MSAEQSTAASEELAALAAYHQEILDGTERSQNEALARLKKLQQARRQLGAHALTISAEDQSDANLPEQPEAAASYIQ